MSKDITSDDSGEQVGCECMHLEDQDSVSRKKQEFLISRSKRRTILKLSARCHSWFRTIKQNKLNKL